VFSVEDHTHARGLVGFSAKNNKQFWIDNIHIVPYACSVEAALPPVIYQSPTCSRFRENYVGAIQ
jgi:hypothetical protein